MKFTRIAAPAFRLILLASLLVGCGPRPDRAVPAAATTGVVRVVSLAPSLTEIICAIGAADCLVGRSSACHYPPEIVKNIPIAGDFGIPSLEMLAKCAPQLVVTVDLEDKNSARAIEQLGIRHEQIPCNNLDDIPPAIRTIGRLLHHEPAANKLADEMSSQLTNLRAQPRPAHPPRVFVEVWGDPLQTAGKHSFLTELIELAGGQNIAADVDRDFYSITPETVLARDPEVLIMLEFANTETAAKAIAARSGWLQLSAVRNGRICTGLDQDILETPGPRILQSVALLRHCLQHEP